MNLKAWASSTALALLSQTAFAYQYGICSDGVAQHRKLRCTYSHNATEYIDINFGGEGEIRTPESREGLPVFKTGAINRSATSPSF